MNDRSGYLRGVLIAALSAIGLIGAMFLEWFSRTDIPSGDPGIASMTESKAFTAWEAFSVTDIALAVLVGVVLVVPLLSAVGIRLYRYGPGPILAVAAAIAVALVASQVLAPPTLYELEAAQQFMAQHESRSLGLFVGLLATIGMAAGGIIAAMPALRERAAARDAADAASAR